MKQVCSSFSEIRPTSEISEISKIEDFFRSLFSTLFVKCTFATSPSIFGFLTQVKTKVVLHVLTPPQSPENFFLKNQTSGGFAAFLAILWRLLVLLSTCLKKKIIQRNLRRFETRQPKLKKVTNIK